MLSPSKAGQSFFEDASPQDHPLQQMYGSSLPRKTSFHRNDSQAVSEVWHHLNRARKILEILLRCTPYIFTCILFYKHNSLLSHLTLGQLRVYVDLGTPRWPGHTQLPCWPGHTLMTCRPGHTLLTWGLLTVWSSKDTLLPRGMFSEHKYLKCRSWKERKTKQR